MSVMSGGEIVNAPTIEIEYFRTGFAIATKRHIYGVILAIKKKTKKHYIVH